MANYRKIWENNFGSIPKDDDGRPYEIHHIDGDRNNNSIENLLCVSIKEHYDIHYKNGDYGACVLIAKRMEMPTNYLSVIQKGKKRPGVGGVKKGTTPWNKGITGYSLNISENGLHNKLKANKKNCKISDLDSKYIRKQFENKISVDGDIGKIMRNGKPMSYERAFCKHFCKMYGVSEQYIYRIIKGKSKIV